MKLDVLAFGAHPDDVELACSGTLVKLKKAGKKVGVIDLTQGEMGTRGSGDIRLKEAMDAADIMQLDVRENLNLGDVWFEINKENKLKVIEAIRAYQPDMIFMNAVEDRHVDHPRAAELVKQAAFLSGLSKIETKRNGVPQERWRPSYQFHYIQYQYLKPNFIVDISEEFETKMKSILAYRTQFYNPDSLEDTTLISQKGFLDYIQSRAREFGSAIEKDYGEGFVVNGGLMMDPSHLLY